MLRKVFKFINKKVIKRIIDMFNHEDDPVYKCDVYKEEGCVHVDGLFCNFPNCNILNNYCYAKNKSNKQK